MAYSTYLQLGSTGMISTSENGNLYLAFNDNEFSTNSGKYIFNLYLSGTLVGSKEVVGNYNNWQPSFSLMAGCNYNYTASGIVNNGDSNWGPDGWINHVAETIKGEGLANSYVNREIPLSSPFTWGNGNLVPGVSTFSSSQSIKFSSIQSNLSFQDTVVTVNARVKDNLAINGVPISENIQDVGIFKLISGYTFNLKAGESFAYGIVSNPFSITFPEQFPKVGGDIEFIFSHFADFLAPKQFAYSLVGQFIGLNSPNSCLNIGGINLPSTGNPSLTGSGYNPSPGYIPPENDDIKSGILSISIENSGSYCSDGIVNKIVEFSIDSYYSVNKELNLNFEFEEYNSSYAKYLAYTQDEQYILQYTGYVTTSGLIPITYQTGYILIYQDTTGYTPNYITGIDSGVQICYVSGVIGSGVVATGTGIIDIYYGQDITGMVASGSGYVEYNVYYQQSGSGVVTETFSGFDPQMYVYKDGNIISYNDDWEENVYVDQIRNLTAEQSIILPYVEAANLFDIVGGSGFSVNISKSPKYNPQDNFIRKNSSTIKLVQDSGFRYDTFTSPMAGWASYNVSTGMNSKNVIGYAIEITDDLLLSGQQIIDTGVLRGIPPTIFSTGSDIRSEYIGYCFVDESLECEDKEINDVSICFTGDPNGSGYNAFVSGILKKFKNSAITDFDPIGTLSIQSGIIPSYFQLWSGFIEYNTFVSGDKLNFQLYPFDYTGLYNQYFNVNPPHQSTGLTLTNGIDFNNINQLVSTINNKLSGINFPVWYPYDCISGSGQQGIYVSGQGLMYAQIRDLPTGDPDYNNIVDFFSLRNNTGYYINLSLTDRPITEQNNNTAIKYLLPSYIALQGSNDNSAWTTIDVHSGIDWTSIEPTRREITGLISGIPTNLNIVDVPVPEDEEEVFVDTTGDGGYQTLYKFIQSGNVKIGDKCPLQSFEREISIIKPTGFPPGTQFDPETCAPTGNIDEDGQNQDGQGSGDGTGNSQIQKYVLNYLRTGWVLDSGTAGQPITGINYDYYRIYLSGFQGNNTQYQTIVNTFIVNNINLYSSLVNSIPVHTGDIFCSVGANYTVQVEGYVPVQLSGLLSEVIDANESGVFEINNQAVLMKISGLDSGDLVRFNKVSGRLISSSGTGFITDRITGSGCFTSGATDWFYNPTNNIVTFEQIITGCITGSGRFSGQFIRLKPAVVNQQLAGGGFISSLFNISITTGATFTGLAPVDFLVENLNSVYAYTGITGGYAALGYFQLNTGISINLNGESVDYVEGGITGFINASAILNYNNPQEFDMISINGQSISYNADSGNWIAPSYFATSGQLLDIINSDPGSFASSGFVENGLIKLVSLISGESGNNIITFTNRGTNTGNQTPVFNSTSFTGGQNLYRQLKGTGLYSGNLSILLFHTGFYSVNDATGILTGFIPTYQGVRDFTGVWDLSTGNFFTGYNGFLSSNLTGQNALSYFNMVGGNGYAVSPLNIDVNLFYRDLFNTQSNSDIIRLTFSGSGISGISKIITGIFQLGG